MRRRTIKVVEKKLQAGTRGRYKIYGQAFENRVELDPRQSPKAYLDTLLHELLHVAQPNASEYRVSRTANLLSRTLWRVGYRRVSQ